jgi:hypothetical protein
MANGRGLIVPRTHAAVVSHESSGANTLMLARTGGLRAQTVLLWAPTERLWVQMGV